MPDGARKRLGETVASIRAAKLVRESRASCQFREFKSYLRTIWGYRLKYNKRRHEEGRKYSTYSMVSVVPKRLFLANKLYSAEWLEANCTQVDQFFGRGHDEKRKADRVGAGSVEVR